MLKDFNIKDYRDIVLELIKFSLPTNDGVEWLTKNKKEDLAKLEQLLVREGQDALRWPGLRAVPLALLARVRR